MYFILNYFLKLEFYYDLISEKILSKKNLEERPVSAGEIIDCRIDGIFVHDAFHYVKETYEKMGYSDGPPKIWNKEKFYHMNEHFQPAGNILTAERNKASREFARKNELKYFYDSHCGICHQMMFDYGHVRPGELIVGTDSHTTIYGALNAAGTGIASEDAAYAIAFGELWLQVPETIRTYNKRS